MNLDAQFFVTGLVTGESGQLHVIGRCGDAPVSLGDVFPCVFRLRRPEFPSGMGDPPVREPGEHEIALRVHCIHAYGKSLRELGAGMTASLALVGDGVEHVSPGVVLGPPSSTCIEASV